MVSNVHRELKILCFSKKKVDYKHKITIYFRKLILNKLDDFEVPEIISEIDQSSFNNVDLNKLNELITQKKSFIRKCLERYQTMIYLEEAAQSQYLAQFNEKNINIQITEIKCDDENGEQFKFEIRIDVSSIVFWNSIY